MAVETRYPTTVSVYEALRMRPAARERLTQIGLTRDLFDYPIADAARELGISVDHLTKLLEDEQALEK